MGQRLRLVDNARGHEAERANHNDCGTQEHHNRRQRVRDLVLSEPMNRRPQQSADNDRDHHWQECTPDQT